MGSKKTSEEYYSHAMDWFIEVIKKNHQTKDDLLKFLYTCEWPYDAQFELIEFIEKNDGTPVSLWNRFPKTWYKILYSVSLTIEAKATGKIAFYYPNGSYKYVYEKVDDIVCRKLEVIEPPTPMMLLEYVKGNYISK